MMRAVAVVLAFCSAFWVFYSARLLVVTGFLQQTRPGGQGAFIGAVVFPLLAFGFGWAARTAWRRGAPRAN
jgi:hypothetical protein